MATATEKKNPRRLTASPDNLRIAPQTGPQEAFCRCNADIAGCGGSRGGGKTVGLLLDPLYDMANSGFTAVLFRRTYPEIRREGGPWDTSIQITTSEGIRVPFYPSLGASPTESRLEWKFPSGATLRMAHMENENDRLAYLGSQIPWIGFDQLELFTERQWWDMLGCNRSLCGAKTRMRFSCNPDPDHFLRHLLSWWIDDDSGLPIHERAGKTRWFARLGNEIMWGDTRDEVIALCGPDAEPLSFAFFPSTVFDNPILLKGDPKYLANLKALREVERERMLGGNWNVRERAGTYFRRDWFGEPLESRPTYDRAIRYWDRAATPEAEAGTMSSWTAGVLLGRYQENLWTIMHSERFHGGPAEVEQRIDAVAERDGREVFVGIEQDPSQAGKAEAMYHARRLAAKGFTVLLNPVRENKGARARPFSAAVQNGLVKLVRGPWNDAYLNELENFDGTDKCISDQVDATSGGFYKMTTLQVAGTWGR